MVCSSAGTCEFIDMGGYMAAGIGWARKVHETWCFGYDYGLMRQCDYTFILWLFCRSIRPAHRILGFISLLFIPGLLCNIRAQTQDLEVSARTKETIP